MQDLQTGEMHPISAANALTVDRRRIERNNALLQVDFKGIPVPAGHQGPVFRVGEEIVLKAEPVAQTMGAAKNGTITVLNISRILKKGLVLSLQMGDDARQIFKGGHIIEIKGGRFRVDSAGASMVVLQGLPGVRVRKEI